MASQSGGAQRTPFSFERQIMIQSNNHLLAKELDEINSQTFVFMENSKLELAQLKVKIVI